ncbi:methyltransferase domain-containing protein [uncultured Parasphingorhabdus sp.]|uniref:class I SAM-dependent methyltransferase n=1 Tax=uncultured Parasphingorhabdus sp. TaxID=2709694 RepID=UPI00374923D0
MSRRLAVLASKKGVNNILQQKLKSAFDDLGEQAPEQIEQTAAFRLWSGFNAASQSRMWRVLAEQIDRDYDRIHSVSATVESPPVERSGTEIPAYQFQTHIHGQPGGYMLERAEGDIAAGILYEAGGNIYALGQGIGKSDSKGQRLIAYIRDNFPDLKPLRILEMGCSAGGQTADYSDAFPDAEIHAIDLSPGMLNYARARTTLVGGNVHFHQADAGNTGFEDDSFDLIISHNMFHEVAAEHMGAIARESFRLLRSGGLCIHQDVPIQTGRLDNFMRFVSAWQRDYNNEPFWMDFSDADIPQMLIDAGFEENKVHIEYVQAIAGPVPWYVVSASR